MLLTPEPSLKLSSICLHNILKVSSRCFYLIHVVGFLTPLFKSTLSFHWDMVFHLLKVYHFIVLFFKDCLSSFSLFLSFFWVTWFFFIWFLSIRILSTSFWTILLMVMLGIPKHTLPLSSLLRFGWFTRSIQSPFSRKAEALQTHSSLCFLTAVSHIYIHGKFICCCGSEIVPPVSKESRGE